MSRTIPHHIRTATWRIAHRHVVGLVFECGILPMFLLVNTIQKYTQGEREPMFIELPVEQLAEAINDCAEELLAEAGIDRPPIDAVVMARRLGLVVARDSHSPVRGR